MAMAQVGRAEISLRRDDPAWARATAARAVEVFSSLPDYLLQADAIRVYADASDRLGLADEADESLARALALSRSHEHRTQEAQTLQTSARILARRGSFAQARSSAGEARELFARLGSIVAAEEMVEFLVSLPTSRDSR